MIFQILSNLIIRGPVLSFKPGQVVNAKMFDKIVGYDGIKRTFLRSLNSREPVHILLIGQPGRRVSVNKLIAEGLPHFAVDEIARLV